MPQLMTNAFQFFNTYNHPGSYTILKHYTNQPNETTDNLLSVEKISIFQCCMIICDKIIH